MVLGFYDAVGCAALAGDVAKNWLVDGSRELFAMNSRDSDRSVKRW